MNSARLLLSLSLLSGSFAPAAAQSAAGRSYSAPVVPGVIRAPGVQSAAALGPSAPSLFLPTFQASFGALPSPALTSLPESIVGPAPVLPLQAPSALLDAAGEGAVAQGLSALSEGAGALPDEGLGGSRRRIIGRFHELLGSFGSSALPEEAPVEAAAPQAASAPAKLDKPITYVDKKGITHYYSYDPANPGESLWKAFWRTFGHPIETFKRVREYMRRVRQVVGNVTDEDLWWSVNRLKSLETQEGILRSDNRELINQWGAAGQAAKAASPADFAGAALSPESIKKVFKTAMDLEEPTLQYQFAFAQNLHNRLHRMSHFLGTTLQEHILAAALKGRASQMAIWSNEEVRHGPILERVYEQTRDPAAPPVVQEGEAPRLPRNDARYLVLSGMANRSLAEIAAASAYLTIKANTPHLSPTDEALEGLFRDETYHYIIMATVNRFVFGHGRLERLYRIFRHDLDYRPVDRRDRVKHRRPLVSPLSAFAVGYAFLTIDKRIDRFIRTQLTLERAKDLIGPTYTEDSQLQASLARGEQTLTRHFRMEQNPHLTSEDVRRLEQKLPGWIDAKERKIKASDIKGVIDDYRRIQLTNPAYWMRRKGFRLFAPVQGDFGPTLVRTLEKDPKASVVLVFPKERGASPIVRVGDPSDASRPSFQAELGDLTMLQIGAIMDAEDLGVVERLQELRVDLSYPEIMKRVGRSPAYQKDPIPVVEE